MTTFIFTVFSFVFKSCLTFSFHSGKMTLGRRKDAEREKIGERKNGKREGFTEFRKLSA